MTLAWSQLDWSYFIIIIVIHQFVCQLAAAMFELALCLFSFVFSACLSNDGVTQIISNQVVQPVITGFCGWAIIGHKLPQQEETAPAEAAFSSHFLLVLDRRGIWRQGDVHHALARRYFGNGFCSNVPEGVALLSQSLMRRWGRVTVFKRGKQNKAARRVFASTAVYLNTHTNPTHTHKCVRALTDEPT